MSGSSPKAEDGKKKARIEIIPLIDVIFFLLATFVLFTLSLNRIQSLDVQLPKAVDNPSNKPDEDIVTLQVSDVGTYYWKIGTGPSELITKEDIVPRLQQLSQNANARVLIAGDYLARFGPTVQALDEVRKAGIAQVSVETRVRSTGK